MGALRQRTSRCCRGRGGWNPAKSERESPAPSSQPKLRLGPSGPPLTLNSNPSLKQPLSQQLSERPSSERETRSTAAGRAPVASISTAEALADQEEDEEAEDEDEAEKEEDKGIDEDAVQEEAQDGEAEDEAEDNDDADEGEAQASASTFPLQQASHKSPPPLAIVYEFK